MTRVVIKMLLLTTAVLSILIFSVNSIIYGVSVGYGEIPFPFIVSVQECNRQGICNHICGGTYIGDGVIITAAHCMQSREKDIKYGVMIGQTNVSELSNIIPVKQHVIHPGYNPYVMRDDIALIKVVDPTLDSDGLPLAQNGSILSDCFVLGYGASSNAGKPSGELRIGKVRLISQSFCVDLLGRITAPTGSDGKMCALGLGANTCPGDSGGPLFCANKAGKLVLYGITSYGYSCEAIFMPGVYTSVTPYLNWIEFIMDKEF